jgi:hypothetical protein
MCTAIWNCYIAALVQMGMHANGDPGIYICLIMLCAWCQAYYKQNILLTKLQAVSKLCKCEALFCMPVTPTVGPFK